ncbi:hypothetical protein B9Z19DRAFT_1068725 [Tuber borchii]|uniref:Uncharacterized protein n=1 Tax=Tuber borchii TaxID=42251 RepID=A0A2T6ZE58_TUBBO|nr:hypothetical protein B9Z19DRAFT_1068725 [Tuber borchii]
MSGAVFKEFRSVMKLDAIFKEIKEAIKTRSHDIVEFHDVDPREFEKVEQGLRHRSNYLEQYCLRIHWFAFQKILKVIMPLKLHKSPAKWLYEMIQRGLVAGLITEVWVESIVAQFFFKIRRHFHNRSLTFGNNGKALVERLGGLSTDPWISAIVAVWKVIIKAIFLQTINGDLLKLVYYYSRFRMLPSADLSMWLKPKPKLMLFPPLPPSFSLSPVVHTSPVVYTLRSLSHPHCRRISHRQQRAPEAQGQCAGFQLEAREVGNGPEMGRIRMWSEPSAPYNEAHTSLCARKAICEIEGLDDKDLDTIYKGPASSAIMIRSEMEPPPLSPSSAGMKGRLDAFQPTNRPCPRKKSYNLNAPSTNPNTVTISTDNGDLSSGEDIKPI